MIFAEKILYASFQFFPVLNRTSAQDTRAPRDAKKRDRETFTVSRKLKATETIRKTRLYLPIKKSLREYRNNTLFLKELIIVAWDHTVIEPSYLIGTAAVQLLKALV